MMAGGGAFVQVGHFHVSEVVFGEILPLGLNIDLEQFGGVEAKNFRFEVFGQGRISIGFLKFLRHLKSSEGFDLPLGCAVPN